MKIFFKIRFLTLLLSSMLFSAPVSYTQNSTAQQLADQIQGIGITITNPIITHGDGTQVGIFSNAIEGANLEIDEGIILTCMTVDESFTTNSSEKTSLVPSETYNDTDLLDIDSRASYNPIIFEFDVTLDENTRLLLIDYQFASEEYPEYVGSKFNDTFGFFISGGDLNQTYNIARVVDNTTYVNIDNIDNYPTVTVNNVNGGELGSQDDDTPQDLTNSEFYIDNNQNNDDGTSPILVEYDGLTHTLHASLDKLTPGQTYHFKMALADTSDAKWDTGVFINKINGLREPSICYDYAYKQNSQYLTEDYNASSGPYINANVLTTMPIEVGMYFKNTQESEIVASNVMLNILDINTTQATYATDSVFITEANSIIKTFIPDVNSLGMTVSTGGINNIPVDSFDSLDYFYTYFSLNPSTDSIYMPIKAQLVYDLTIPLSLNDSITIPRSSLIDSEIPMCGGSAFDYAPDYGSFNVVENGLYNASTSYYNINTQVTNREADLSVIAMDPDNLNTLKNISTIVAVDMIDLKSFHYTNASCDEASNSITPRVWVVFDQQSSIIFDSTELNNAIIDGRTTLTESASYFSKARQKAAFRISYNSMDNNNSVVKLVKNVNDNYSISNWRPEWSGRNCSQDIDGDSTTTDTVKTYCNLATGTLTSEDLANCMECIYGLDTKYLCSRDNFAIRPESFLINLNDQNQTNHTLQTKIPNTFSGVLVPIATEINLAAGYAYNLEVNATTHIGNASSAGYHTSEVNASYIWSPKIGRDVSGCNDTLNKSSLITFASGVVDKNTSVTQVGSYRLNLLDTTWTIVDSDSKYMTHHISPYFQVGTDCVLNSTNVQAVGDIDSLNGCNISSKHTNSEANLVYNDYNITFHPYKFNMSAIVPSIGLDFNASLDINSFIYMSDMSFNNTQDQNMSFHLNGNIRAVGYNDGGVSNFVSSCYAKRLDLNVSKSNTALLNALGASVTYQAKLHNFDVNGTIIVADTLDVNETDHATPIKLQTTPIHFTKELNGALNTRLNLNYNKESNIAVNPIRITYNNYDIGCTDAITDCTFYADLNTTNKTKGSLNLDQNITHYYGRTHAPLYRYTTPSAVGLIYYEVYCSGVGCDKTLLQNGVNSRYNDDPRWFINTQHTASFGSAGAITQKGTRNNITANNAGTNVTTGNHPDSMTFTYDTLLGYPYKGTMQNTPSRWLVYNPYDINDTTNEFDIEYSKVDAGWSGVNSTDSSTSNDGAQRTNRRSMW